MSHSVHQELATNTTPNSYCRMRDVFDEAIQLLYWACRERRGFPGDILDESPGKVTTDAILRGLGLIEPGQEDPTAATETRKELDPSEDQRLDQDRPLTLSSADDSTQNHKEDLSPSRSLPSLSSRSYDGSVSGSVPALQSTTTNEMNFDMNVDVDQPETNMQGPSTVSSCETTPDKISAPSAMASPAGYGMDVEYYRDVDAFMDANFYGMPDTSGNATLGEFTDAMIFKNHYHHHGQVNGPLFSEQQIIPAPRGDSFLSPWPGSLAAAYSSVPTV